MMYISMNNFNFYQGHVFNLTFILRNLMFIFQQIKNNNFECVYGDYGVNNTEKFP